MNQETITLEEKNIERISALITTGKVLIIPASTIYGLSASAADRQAIDRIYKIKKRKRHKPLITLISDTSQIAGLASSPDAGKNKIIEALWEKEEPEQVTLILKALKNTGTGPAAKAPKIAIRPAADPVLKKIIARSGPIVSTSADISGSSLAPKSIEEIPQEIRDEVDAIVETAQRLQGMPSTILDISENKPLLIREGRVKLLDIQKMLKIR